MTIRAWGALLLTSALAAGGCTPSEPTTARSEDADRSVTATVVGSHLPTPFTADEIRAEWIEGLELVMRRSTPDGESLERWRVISADEDGVDIEFSPIDALGRPVGEPRLQRSGWEDLRDHARFPADRASRTRVVETTPLGELEGWLYTVKEPEEGVVSNYFFAESLPGAPVHFTVVNNDQTILELVQMERGRPPAPDQG